MLIYNNTDESLIVSLGYDREIKKNKFTEFYLPYADAIYLSVIDSKGRTQYDLPLVSREYIKSGVIGDEIKMQIDPMGIYVVLPDAEFPVGEFPAQPNGYPLKH